MHDSAPVFLQTDASDYGIGAYLFQVIDGIAQPVAFVSKAFAREQLHWSTPEKEAYAIFYSFQKLEYLIRDVHFTLQTDHRNLTFINTNGSPKVIRWKVAIQEYDFEIEHIPGHTNVVADSFSRICSSNDTEVLNAVIDDFRIPREHYKQIGQVHNSTVGHHGIERTMTKLLEIHTPWPYMREHVRKFIKTCPCCQKMSYLRIPIHTHPFTTASYSVMERVNVDTVGPLPMDEYGNKYIIVFIDCFSRFIELYAVPDTSAKHAARSLLNFVGRYGIPAQLLSDNGSQFVNELLTEFFSLINTEHVRTLAYSKEENAIVERVNKEVMRHLRAIIFDKNLSNDWSDCLPIVQRIINSEKHSVINVSPAEILFGNSIQLDRGIFLPTTITSDPVRMSSWTSKMLQRQADIIKLAQQFQQKHDDTHIANHSAQRTEFPINF
jgi:hypothetical protein